MEFPFNYDKRLINHRYLSKIHTNKQNHTRLTGNTAHFIMLSSQTSPDYNLFLAFNLPIIKVKPFYHFLNHVVNAQTVCYFSLGFCKIVSILLLHFCLTCHLRHLVCYNSLRLKLITLQARRSFLHDLKAGLSFNNILL